MKEKMTNQADVTGYLYDYKLDVRTSQAGNIYVSGEVQVATDEEAMNVVKVNFPYVAQTKKDGSPNDTHLTLVNLLESPDNTFKEVGNAATKIRVSGSVWCNDFVNRNNEMVSPKQIRGSFVHIAYPTDGFKASFKVDAVITNAVEKEGNSAPYVELSALVFDFRKAVAPVTFTVSSADGMAYFLDQQPTQTAPFFTGVWGDFISSTTVKTKETESAFGAPQVEETVNSIRLWEVLGCEVEPYIWDDESTITAAELKDALDKREEELADVRRRAEEYAAKKQGTGFGQAKPATPTAPANNADGTDDFGF